MVEYAFIQGRVWGRPLPGLIHGELRASMSLTSSMMYISPALLLILYGYIGFSESAPRISPSDASSISSRKPGSGGWDAFRTGEPRAASPGTRTLSAPPAGITSHPTSPGSPGSEKATTFQPPTTDPTTTTSRTTVTPDAGIISPIKEQITAPSSRLTLSRKRSTDAQTSLFSPEKMLQTMVSMVSQHTTNDAWAADNADASVTSVENSQGERSGMSCCFSFCFFVFFYSVGFVLHTVTNTAPVYSLTQAAGGSRCLSFWRRQRP